tara:strand:- start:6692 stop:7177 length:486 start_codon:yes stop_codon:yes gene_type:complete
MKEPKKLAKTGEIVSNSLRSELEQKLANIVQNRALPQAVESVVAVLSEHHYNESKLPSAQELQMLESVVPGGAREAIDMAKAEQKFMISETAKNNRRGFTVDLMGPIFGFLALLSLIGLCMFMVVFDQAIYAAAVVGAIGVSAAIFFRPMRVPAAKDSKKK